MTDYDFRALSPIEFEQFCQDLLQAELGHRLESFKPGTDQGIDLRAYIDHGRELIVQCKHYVGSGFNKLESQLRLSERPKVDQLAPARYIIATSVPLNPQNKKALLSAIGHHCHGPHDVLGKEDLNNLLGQHPNVERNHYKLWITSTAILDLLIHADMFQQSLLERQEIEHRLALHVQTNATPMAWDILDQHNYCIISGIPGIGKTTLAEILVADLISNGYELLVARSHVNEVLGRIQPGKRYVVYYDDFLGQSNFSEKLGKNEEQSLFRLLQLAHKHQSLKVILTTREYILVDARAEYERLDDETIYIAKCVIDLESYTRGDRAQILYNHLYFYNVSQDQIESLLAEQQYLQIIDHDNYSPRVIEAVVKAKCSSDSIFDRLKLNLDDPMQIWASIFQEQLSDDSRDLLFLLATLSQTTKLDSLRQVFFASNRTSDREDKVERRFNSALRTLDGTFITTIRDEGESLVEFANPSIHDFMRMRISESPSTRGVLTRNSVFFGQLEALYGHASYDRPEYPVPFDEIARSLVQLFFSSTDGVHRVYFSRDLNKYSWVGNRHGFDRRARTVLDWIHRADSQPTHEQLLIKLLEMCFDDPTVSDLGDLCGLTEVLLQLECSNLIIDKARERLLSDTDEFTILSDWRKLGTIVSTHSKLFNPTDFANKVDHGLKSWLESRDYDDPDDRESDCDGVEAIAGMFDLELTDEIDELRESEIYPSWSDERTSKVHKSRPIQSNPDASDRDISYLFSSLRQ